MPKVLSLNLLHPVVQHIRDGRSCRQAAARFNVSASSAIRWHRAWRQNGFSHPSLMEVAADPTTPKRTVRRSSPSSRTRPTLRCAS